MCYLPRVERHAPRIAAIVGSMLGRLCRSDTASTSCPACAGVIPASGEVIERPDLAVSFEELNTLVGFDDVQAIEKRYLTEDQLEKKYRGAAE